MAVVSDSEIRSLIRLGKPSRVYYFYGKDIANVEANVKEVVSCTVKKGSETYNFHSFDGKTLNIEELVDACEALPVFADYVCCTVCNLNADSMGANALTKLTKYISDLPDTTVLVFYNTSIDITDGRKYPTAKNKKLVDAAAKAGTVCCFMYKTPAQLSKGICSYAAKAGASISLQNAALVAELCGCSTIMIKNEMDKLTAYTGKNEITEDVIRILCPRQIETTTFDLAKAIARHDRANAMKLLHDLQAEKTEPISIMYAVSGNIVDIYRAKVAISSAKTPSDVMNDFGYAKNLGFRVDNAFREASRYSLTHLRKCVTILTETDVKMKSTSIDKMILLEEAIVLMLSAN